jgi:hypothetical protein
VSELSALIRETVAAHPRAAPEPIARVIVNARG